MKFKPLAIAAICSIALHASVVLVVSASNSEVRLRTNLMHGQYRVAFAKAKKQQGPAPLSPQLDEGRPLEEPDNPQESPTEASSLDIPEEYLPTSLALNDYLTPDQLTSQATPTGIVNLDAIQITEPMKPGILVLKIWIDSTGRVIRSEIENTDFPTAYSDAVARVFSEATFSPGQVNGLPVNSILRIETSYD